MANSRLPLLAVATVLPLFASSLQIAIAEETEQPLSLQDLQAKKNTMEDLPGTSGTETEQEKRSPFPKILERPYKVFQSNKLEKARSQVAQILPTLRASERDQAHLLLGRIAIRQNDLSRAEKHLRKSLSYRARNSDTLYYLGTVQYRSGRNEQALKTLEEAVWFKRYHERSPAETFLQISRVHTSLEQYEEAEVSLRKAVSGEKVELQAIPALTDLLLQSGRRAEALDLFKGKLKKLSEADPAVQLAYARAVLLHPNRNLETKQLKEVAELLEGLRNQKGERPLQPDLLRRTHVLSVQSFMTVEEYDRAETLLTDLLRKSPNDPFLTRLRTQLTTEREAYQIANGEKEEKKATS